MKRILSMILLLALILSGCGSESSSSQEESVAEPVATVLGRVSSISGNDVALTLGTYGTSAVAQDSGVVASTSSEEGIDRPSRSSGTGSSEGSGRQAAPGAGTPPEGAPSGVGGDSPVGENNTAGEDNSGRGATIKFKETGESWVGRILVGTPIQYGTLKVDFSQLQVNYIVSLSLGGPDGNTIVAGEILSTS